MTNKAMRVLGYIEWGVGGLAAIGTWTTTNLRCVQLMGLGVRLPGQLVQASANATPANNVVRRCAGQWNLSLTFACFDPCNPVKLTAQANLYPDASEPTRIGAPLS